MADTPLKEEDIKAINLVLRSLRIIVSNIQLYSAKSQLVKDNTVTLNNLLNDYFNRNNQLSISESDRKIIVNGQPLTNVDKSSMAFIDSMMSNNIKSITFNRGVTTDELLLLLENLAAKKRDKKDNVGKFLKEKGVTHIELNERVYVVVGDKDEVTKKQTGGASAGAGVSGDKPADTKQGSGGQQGGAGGAGGEGAGGGISVTAEQVEKLAKMSGMTKQEFVKSESAKLMDGDRKGLITEQKRKELSGLLKELDSINQVDIAGQVVDKMAENLDDASSSVRLDAVKSFKNINPAIQSLSDKKIIDRLENKFIATEEKETSEDVYNGLADLLEDAANRNVDQGEYEKPIKIVKMFRLHRYARDEGFESRWECAETVMRRLSNSGLINILIGDLRSVDKTVQEEAYMVILSLEEYGVHALISTLKEVEDLHLRRIIAFVVKNLGEESVREVVLSITTDLPEDNALKIIEILDSVGHPDIVTKELKSVLAHYSMNVKKAALNMLAKINPEGVKSLVLELLDDFDISIRKEAAKVAGKIELKEAVAVLTKFLAPESIFGKPGTDYGLQEEACTALGKIKDDGAINTLVETAGAGSMIKLQKQKPASVRTAAVYALSNYKPEKTKNYLLKLLSDKDTNLVKAVKEAVKKQENSVHQKGNALAARML